MRPAPAVRVVLVVLLVLVTGALAAPAAAADPPWRPDLLPRDQEVADALAACPPAVAQAAGVHVLGERGYELARESANGFHTLVGRSVPGSYEPQCFDAEGSATQLRRVLLEAELRMAGHDQEAIDRELAAAYAAGRLRAPSRAGINYMLSPKNRVPVDAAGTVRPYRPHVMFYVPYLSDADLGGGDGSPVFVINGGGPEAYAIVPVPTPGDVWEPHAHE